MGLFTPSQTAAEQESIASAVKTLDGEVWSSKAPANFKKAWENWEQDWWKFYENNSSVAKRALNTVYDKTQEFKAQVEEWKNKLGEFGTRSILPKSKTMADLAKERMGKLDPKLLLVVGGGLLLLGGVFVVARR